MRRRGKSRVSTQTRRWAKEGHVCECVCPGGCVVVVGGARAWAQEGHAPSPARFQNPTRATHSPGPAPGGAGRPPPRRTPARAPCQGQGGREAWVLRPWQGAGCKTLGRVAQKGAWFFCTRFMGVLPSFHRSKVMMMTRPLLLHHKEGATATQGCGRRRRGMAEREKGGSCRWALQEPFTRGRLPPLSSDSNASA